MRSLLFLLLVAPWLMVTAAAADTDTKATDTETENHPGFVRVEAGSIFDREHLDVHVSIKDAMLRLVAAAARESEPELADMIGGLRAVEVRVFTVDDATEGRVSDAIASTAALLKKQGWDPAIDIRLENSQGFVYFRFDQEAPIGLAAMFLDQDREAMFINIVGTIDPTLVGKLAARFNISILGDALPGN